MEVFEEFVVTIYVSLAASALVFLAVRQALASETNRSYFADRIHSLDSRWANRVFWIFFLSYLLVFTILALLRYFSFHTGYLELDTSWDLGLFNQALWNSLHGRLLGNSFIIDAPNYLGKSFSPILLSFVPLYALWASPVVLLIVQTFGLGLGAFPIYWIARQRIGYSLALVVVAAYFLFPGLENIGLNEFHDIALEAPVLAFATFFLLRQHYKGFLVCLGIALLVKEEIGFVTIAYGAFVFLIQRKRVFGVALVFFGIGWSILLLQYVIPFFRGSGLGAGFYYFGNGLTGGGGSRYGYLGHSLPEITFNLLTQPQLILGAVSGPAKAEYLLGLLVPLMFIPIVGAEVGALALPTLGYSLLSTYPLQYSTKFYYIAPIIPFLFLGLAMGLGRLLKWRSRGSPRDTQDQVARQIPVKAGLAVLILVASGVSYYFDAPGPLGGYFQPWRYVLDSHAILGNLLTNTIPGDATLVAQNEFLAQLSNRQRIYEIPIPDYRQVDYMFADTTKSWYNVHKAFWENYIATGYFQVLTQEDGYVIAKRREPDHPLQIRFGNQIRLLGYSIVTTDTVRGGTMLQPSVLWQVDQPIADRYKFTIQIVDTLGHVWAHEDREPQDDSFPTNKWQVGKPVGDQYALLLPPTMPPGEYAITVGVHGVADSDYLNVYDAQGKSLGTEATLGTLRVEKDKSSHTAGELAKEQTLSEYFVDMQEIRFLGFVPLRQTISPGELLQVGLYWRAREKPRGDYEVAVQLRDATGRVVFEQVSRPANGVYPTTQWDAGEVLLDWHDFNLPKDIVPGSYKIFTVLRDEATKRDLGESVISNILIVQ